MCKNPYTRRSLIPSHQIRNVVVAYRKVEELLAPTLMSQIPSDVRSDVPAKPKPVSRHKLSSGKPVTPVPAVTATSPVTPPQPAQQTPDKEKDAMVPSSTGRPPAKQTSPIDTPFVLASLTSQATQSYEQQLKEEIERVAAMQQKLDSALAKAARKRVFSPPRVPTEPVSPVIIPSSPAVELVSPVNSVASHVTPAPTSVPKSTTKSATKASSVVTPPEKKQHIAPMDIDQKPAVSMVITSTSLPEKKRKALKQAAEVCGGSKVTDNFSDSVTHVVCDVTDTGLARRTIKYLLGIVSGVWIVNWSWVEDSLKAGHWVNESAYEVPGDLNGRNGPARGRARVRANEPRLFTGWSFYLHGDFNPPAPKRSDTVKLLQAAGGQIVKRVTADMKKVALICDPFASEAEAKAGVTATKLPATSLNWVLDSVSTHQILPLAEFQLH